MIQSLFHREIGSGRGGPAQSALELEASLRRERQRSISLDAAEICSPHCAPVRWLDVDQAEARFLLSAGADGAVAAWDIAPDDGVSPMGGEPLFVVRKGQHRGAHQFAATVAEWHALDTETFFTAGMDHKAKCWDANALEVLLEFDAGEKIFAMAVPKDPNSSHSLLALGTAATSMPLRLADLRSGAFAQTLTAHRSSVLAAQWSPRHEFLLASGGADGAVHLWDIRRGRVLYSCDEDRTQGFSGLTRKSDGLFAPVSHAPGHAHQLGVTGLRFTPDGLFLLSSGLDQRLRLWDVLSGARKLVNYPGIVNHFQTGSQIAVSSDGEVVYHPSGRHVQGYAVHTGQRVEPPLKAHFGLVTSVCCASRGEAVFSGGSDNQVLPWRPEADHDKNRKLNARAAGEGEQQQHDDEAALQNIDTWSEDD